MTVGRSSHCCIRKDEDHERGDMENGGEKKDGATSEDIRTRRKHAKLQKKLEKKAKMEMEFLLELRKPKDTKVVLADRSVLQGFGNGSIGKPAARSFEFSNSDFPKLSSGKPRTTATCKRATDAFQPKEEQAEVAVVEKALAPKAPPSSSIEVNLEDLIVKKPPKKEENAITKRTKSRRRMIESGSLCGNMLDSSNPRRRRGKHRETEKRTFTKLKLAIIRDRILRLKGKEGKSMADNTDREKFKLELDLYLSDLMKKLKLAKAERLVHVKEKEKVNDAISETEAVEPTKKGKNRKVRKYRKYCDNAYSEDLDKAVTALVQSTVYLQDRAYGKNSIKAKAKSRHVVGLREVKKYLMLQKLKMLIIAPDLEAQETVFNTIEELKKSAAVNNIPCVFALNRRHLGFVSKKGVAVSAFGILNYDGLEDKFAAVKDKLKEAQDKLSSREAPTEESTIPE